MNCVAFSKELISSDRDFAFVPSKVLLTYQASLDPAGRLRWSPPLTISEKSQAPGADSGRLGGTFLKHIWPSRYGEGGVESREQKQMEFRPQDASLGPIRSPIVCL